jgi:ABC-type sugar transport system permease subunit
MAENNATPEITQVVNVPKAKRRGSTMAKRNAIAGILWTLPFTIGFIAFMLVPMFETLQMAFSNVTIDIPNHSYVKEWVGLKNFDYILNADPIYKRQLLESLGNMGLQIIAVLIFSYFVAFLLNQEFKGRAFVRAVFFLPVILSSGILLNLDTNNSLLNGISTLIKESNNAASRVTGVLEDILASGNSQMSDLMQTIFDLVNSVYDIAIASGIQIIIFLSGLQTIPASMYEASKMEGCTGWESFWKITFPMTSSLIIVNVVYSIIDFCTRSDNVVMSQVKATMLQKMDYGLTSSMAWLYFACIAVIVGLVTFIISKWVYYYE